jgi:hypothetical protein
MGLFNRMKESIPAGAMTMPSAADRDAVMAQGNEYKRLLQVGRRGRAVVGSVQDTGERAAGNAVAALELLVTPDDAETYPVSLRFIIAGTDLAPYAPGSSYPVRIDPDDAQNVTFG